MRSGRRETIQRTIFENQRGVSLLAVLITMISLGIALTTGWSLMESTNTSSADFVRQEQALYIAQAGIDAAIMRIEASLLANPDWTNAWPVGAPVYNPAGTLTGSVASGTFTVTFLGPDQHHVTLQSVATLGNCTRTVTKGLTRIARGSNYAIYNGGTGDFQLAMSTWAAGNVYTNGNFLTQGGPGGSRKVNGRLFRAPGLSFNGRALEGRTTLAAARPAIAWNLTSYRNQRAAFDAKIAAGRGGMWDADPLWTGGNTYTYTTDQYFTSLTTGLPGSRITLDTAGNRIDIVVQGNVTISPNEVFVTPGSHVNIIAGGNFSMGQVSQFTDWDTDTGNPAYLYTAGTFSLTQASIKFNAPVLRVMANNFNFTFASTFPAGNNLTLYAFGPNGSIITNSNVVNGVVILDDQASLLVNLAPPRIRGIVYNESSASYPGTDTTIYFTHTDYKIEGSLISNTNRRFLNPGNSVVAVGEGRVWREPDLAVMPTAVGYNPMGTGGYSTFCEQ